MPRSDGRNGTRGARSARGQGQAKSASPPRLDDETGAYPNHRLENGAAAYGSSDTVRNAHAAMDEMAAGGVGGGRRSNPFDAAASLD